MKNPSDFSKFRQQYLANLALEIKNNDINLQANKIYKKTGESPVQVLDTRTTAEKEADIQRLKIEVRKELFNFGIINAVNFLLNLKDSVQELS